MQSAALTWGGTCDCAYVLKWSTTEMVMLGFQKDTQGAGPSSGAAFLGVVMGAPSAPSRLTPVLFLGRAM